MSIPRTRILYIDDDPGMCRLVQKDLERQGYAVEIATGGRLFPIGIEAAIFC
jgi:CheY-like chemotaxis protein